MRRFAKTTLLLFLSAAVLVACGDEEEDATGNDTEYTGEPTESGNTAQEEEENEDQMEKSDNQVSDDSSSDGEADERGEEETSNKSEGEPEILVEGEERKSSTTKEDNYVQGGTFSGGEVTDGKSIGNIDHGMHDDYERLVIDIYEGAYQELQGPAEIPNYFEVTKEGYPSRIVYTLRGIRGLPEEMPDLSHMNYFSTIETIPLFDDATIQLAAYVQEFIEFEVFEMHDPAKIVTDVRPVEEEKEDTTVYSVRTASISLEDNIEVIERKGFELEERNAEQVRTLHSDNDTIMVEEGYYQTLEEAEERKADLEMDGIDFDLHIEERGMHDIPENIE